MAKHVDQMLFFPYSWICYVLSRLKTSKPSVFSQLTLSCSSKSQVESCSLFVLRRPSTACMWLLIPMKYWNIFRQRLAVIRPAQMGYRRRICLKRQKRTLTVRAKLRRSVPPSPRSPSSSSSSPSVPAGRTGTRAASVPLSDRTAALNNVYTMVTSTFALCGLISPISRCWNTPVELNRPKPHVNCSKHSFTSGEI